MKKLLATAALLLLAGTVASACVGQPSSGHAQAQIQTAVAATLTAKSPNVQTHTLTVNELAGTAVAATLTASAPTTAPASPTPAPTATPKPTPTPAVPPITGVWIGTSASAVFYQFQNGQPQAVVTAPNPQGAENVQIIGPHNHYAWIYSTIAEVRTKPSFDQSIIYTTYDHLSSNRIFGWVLGAPSSGKYFAYSVYAPKPDGADSELIIGTYDIQTGNSLAPHSVLKIHDNGGYVLRPFAYQFAAPGQPSALWVTAEKTGIGDTPIAPRRALWRIDLGTFKVTQTLKANQLFRGISPDGTFVAVATAGGKTFSWWQFSNPQPHSVAPVAQVAITHAAFSPSNRWLAWCEVSGSFDNGYHYHLRLLDTTTGSLVVNDQPINAVPALWLNDDLLLLQSWDSQDGTVVVWNRNSKSVVATIQGHLLAPER